MLDACPAQLVTPWASGYAEGYAEGFCHGFLCGLSEILAQHGETDATKAMCDLILEYRARGALGTLRRLEAAGCLSHDEACMEVLHLIDQDRIPAELGGNRCRSHP